MNTRQISIVISFAFAGYISLVCFNNITDYGSNFSFVQHVTGMDGVFSKEKTGWRAVDQPYLHHLFYISLIIIEVCTAIALWTGSIQMTRHYQSAPDVFKNAKKWVNTGLTLGFLLFFGGFIGIAGEWFLMWQQSEWNAQGTAFSLSLIFLGGLIFLNQHDS